MLHCAIFHQSSFVMICITDRNDIRSCNKQVWKCTEGQCDMPAPLVICADTGKDAQHRAQACADGRYPVEVAHQRRGAYVGGHEVVGELLKPVFEYGRVGRRRMAVAGGRWCRRTQRRVETFFPGGQQVRKCRRCLVCQCHVGQPQRTAYGRRYRPGPASVMQEPFSGAAGGPQLLGCRAGVGWCCVV